MENKVTKEAVVDSYGKLAKSVSGNMISKLFACCDPTENATQVGKVIGYSQQEMKAVPEEANLGVGCGNPSAYAKITAGKTLIDLGSGAGFDAFLVAPLVGSSGRVIGIDLSDDMLELAIRNARKGNYRNVEFQKGDIEKLPLEASMADYVISNCVINLSLNKGEVYREAYRVLKPGGELSISDIVLERELPDFIKDSLSGHIACVSGAEPLDIYLGFIAQAGFKEIKVERKAAFPLELMLTDPQVMKLAKEMNFDLSSAEAKEIASRVTSVSISAKK